MSSKKIVKIGIPVRDFAVEARRSGSIDVLSGYSSSGQDGTEWHTIIQNRRVKKDASYQKEVTISHEFKRANFVFEIRGRIDGVIDDEPPVIEEIKSTHSIKALKKRLSKNENHPYILQAKTYAYLYHLNSSEIPKCRLAIVSSRTGSEEIIELDFDPEEFEKWANERLDLLLKSERQEASRQKRRKKIGNGLEFPFDSFRPSQEQLLISVSESIDSSEKLTLQAPTGLGKTAGVLFPALKNSLIRSSKTFYLTPKNSQHQVAADLIHRLRKRKHNVRCLTLTAKRKLCMMEETFCHPDYCEYAKDYYDKIDENELVKQLDKKPILNGSDFIRAAEKYKVCPFELSLETINKKDVIIGDYNYVFAPNVSLTRFIESDDDGKMPNLIIDEAHNLHDRATDYFSPEISQKLLAEFRERALDLPLSHITKARTIIDRCEACLLSHRDEDRFGDYSYLAIPNEERFFHLEQRLTEFITEYIDSLDEPKPNDSMISLLLYWKDFCSILRIVDGDFFITYHVQGEYERLKITCCDASQHLKMMMESFSSVVAFSATLKPFSYYNQLSGFEADTTKTAEFSSPFPRENRKIIVIPQVATNYRERSKNYAKIADAIKRIIEIKQGNYFVFFPSYGFMKSTEPFIDIDGFRIIKQYPGMPRHEVDEISEKLTEDTKDILLLAVQGGTFAEGVDFPGENLIGAIIIGPALPQYNFERDKLREYFQTRFGDGFNYAYTFPGMAKAVQSAGRVIRSETDRGLIVLMDRRFTQKEYFDTMPTDWFDNSVKELVSSNILSEIKDFWNEK